MQIAQHLMVETQAEAQASTLQIMRLAVASEPVVATQNNKSKSEISAKKKTRSNH
jgi:hypothetical protein